MVVDGIELRCIVCFAVIIDPQLPKVQDSPTYGLVTFVPGRGKWAGQGRRLH